MENFHPREIDLGLERTTEVASRLGLMKPKANIITVAGTNGKGSCIRTMEALLCETGKQCGAYSSPHLIRYNERIRVNADEVSDQDICQAFEAIDRAREDISLTYFEFGTLAAFYIFKQKSLDFWLLEVGLGGRLDAVNILDPDIAIITPIDLDHQQWLGETREEIAIEKGGILRSGQPCVIADVAPPKSLLNLIELNNCDYYQLGRDFDLDKTQTLTLSEVGKRSQLTFESAHSDLAMPSVAAACQALMLTHSLPSANPLRKVLGRLKLMGRFQLLKFRDKEWVLDVAHNPAAAELLARRLSQTYKGYRIYAILGMMKDKAIEASIKPLLETVHGWVLTNLNTERAEKPENLLAALERLGVNKSDCLASESMNVAIQNAIALAKQKENEKTIFLVFGSFFTVAECLEIVEPDSLASASSGIYTHNE